MLTKFLCENGQRETNHGKVLENSAEYTKEILEVKKNDILKMNQMTKKLEDSNAAPKAITELY